MLIACAFNFEALTTDFTKLGRVPVPKARMNADLKQTSKANLFVIFGKPDIDILKVKPENGEGSEQLQVKINGADFFHRNTGEIRSDDPDGIACWFVDTDYNEESFFVR